MNTESLQKVITEVVKSHDNLYTERTYQIEEVFTLEKKSSLGTFAHTNINDQTLSLLWGPSEDCARCLQNEVIINYSFCMKLGYSSGS